MEDQNQTFHTVQAIAQRLGLTAETVRQLIRSGKLKAYKQARRWYVLESDVVAWVKGGVCSQR